MISFLLNISGKYIWRKKIIQIWHFICQMWPRFKLPASLGRWESGWYQEWCPLITMGGGGGGDQLLQICQCLKKHIRCHVYFSSPIYATKLSCKRRFFIFRFISIYGRTIFAMYRTAFQAIISWTTFRLSSVYTQLRCNWSKILPSRYRTKVYGHSCVDNSIFSAILHAKCIAGT